MAQREPQRRALRFAASHRDQHGSAARPRRARRAGGTVNPGGVQQHQDGVGGAAGETNIGDAGKAIALRGWAVEDCPWDGLEHCADQGRTEVSQPLFPTRFRVATSRAAANPAVAATSRVPERNSRS